MNNKKRCFLKYLFFSFRNLFLFCLNEVFNHLFVLGVFLLIIGICLGHFGYNFLPGFYGLLLIPSFFFCFFFLFNINKNIFPVIFLTALLFFLLGNFLFIHYTQNVLCKKELVQLFKSNDVVSLTGIVVGDSVWNKVNSSGEIVKQTFPFKVESAILESGEPVNISGKIHVVWLTGAYDLKKSPFYGDRIQLGGLYCNTKFSNRGVGKHILKVSSRSWKSDILEHSVLSHGVFMPLHKYKSFCFRLRRDTLSFFDLGLSNFPDVSGVLKSIIVGRRVFLSNDLKDGLIRTGTIHIIAVSGLHASIVAGIIILVLKFFGCPRYRWFYFLAPIMVTYTFYTGARPSAVRACLMLLIYYFSYVINRKSNILSTVAISAFVILIINPTELFDLGFIFSFLTVLGLILLFPPIYEMIITDKRVNESEFIPQPYEGKSTKQKVISFITSIFVVSLVAWLASMPLGIYFFSRVVFISPIVNVFVVPLTFCLVLLGVLTLFSACISGFLPYIFNSISIIFVKLLEFIIYTSSGLKYCMLENVNLHHCEFFLYIPLIAIVFYYKAIKVRRSVLAKQIAVERAFEREYFD